MKQARSQAKSGGACGMSMKDGVYFVFAEPDDISSYISADKYHSLFKRTWDLLATVHA